MQDLKALEQVLGHTFKDPYLLQTALTHTSYANEARHGTCLLYTSRPRKGRRRN